MISDATHQIMAIDIGRVNGLGVRSLLLVLLSALSGIFERDLFFWIDFDCHEVY